MKQSKTILYLIAFLALLSLSFILGKCSTKKERSQQIDNLIAVRDSVSTLSYTINGLKTSVFEKDALILTEKQAKEAGYLEIERLKKLRIKEVIANADLKGTIKILRDSLKLPPDVQFITVKDTSGVTRDYVRVPFTLIDSTDKHLSIRAGMNANRTAYHSVIVPLAGQMTVGYQKAGLFKSKPVGLFTTSNPYLTVNQMDILIVEKKKKVYQRTWFQVATGVILIEIGRGLLIK